MKQQIEQRFERNIERVQALIELYGKDAGPGRPAVRQADLLRAAVVFLHATLEDIIRSALEWRLPAASAEHLEGIPLVGRRRGAKLTLADIAAHRGKSVDAVIAESVEASLMESNFNNPGDLITALERIGIGRAATLDPHRNHLGAMMKRRHWIVHRADRNDEAGAGQHPARSLNATTVARWRTAVEGFGRALLLAL